jgi:hypothetical protein
VTFSNNIYLHYRIFEVKKLLQLFWAISSNEATHGKSICGLGKYQQVSLFEQLLVSVSKTIILKCNYGLCILQTESVQSLQNYVTQSLTTTVIILT